MYRMTHVLEVLFALLLGAFPVATQTAEPPGNAIPKPNEVTYCELSRNPAAYNHALVRLSAFVSHGFEDFQVTEPDCPTQGFSVWLMYGGKAESNTVYCCPGEAGRETRSDFLTVDGVQIPLMNDPTFQQFIELLKKEPDTTVRSTVIGRFFSGTKETSDRGTFWHGFGHMGCCSLLVIERVESFEPHTRSDLDYTAEAGYYEDDGCKWGSERDLVYISVHNWIGSAQQGIAEQEKADHGQSWAFADPQRVAMESLKLLYPGQLPVLHNVKKTPARQVFRWRSGKKSVVVVVTRPYWLSFYAASNSVAWVTTMIKEAGCK